MIIYVDASALPGGRGSKDSPFQQISDAARIAAPGDEILVAPGIYREYVDPSNAGEENARITYRSTVPLGAVITGAEEVKNWEHYQGNVWRCKIENSVFGNYNPYTTYVAGDWYFAPVIRHTGAVYMNHRAFYEVTSLSDCIEGKVYAPSWEPEWSVYKWYTEQEGCTTVIYGNFQGKDPNLENVEINVRRNCFMPSRCGIGYITLSGFQITKAATTWAPPAAFQDGMVGPHWSKGWIIEECEISNSKCCGISLGKYYDAENDHYFTKKHVKSPTQMERDAVCRGQYHGWTKETIGSHIVRRCHIHHCEQAGIVGRMGCVFSCIQDNHIHHINVMHELGGAEISAIKLHAAIDVLILHNHIHHSTMGIWCDWEAQGTRISQNLLHDNFVPDGTPTSEGSMMSQDIFVEVGHGPTLIDNNILMSKASLRLSAQGVACVHNLILGSFTAVGSGTDFIVNGVNQPRYTPYHIPHRTEVAGFMTILHGDDRVYNNIFVQSRPVKATEAKKDMGFTMMDNQVVGTAVFNDYPTYEEWITHFDMDKPADMMALMEHHFAHLPVWINGNAYFNGAKEYNNECSKLVDTEHPIVVSLAEKEGHLYLKTNLFDFIGDFRSDAVNSDILGYAFEPNERFESPDGTDIVFDHDYYGWPRAFPALPGPFTSGEEIANPIW